MEHKRNANGTLKYRVTTERNTMNKGFTDKIKSSVPKFKILSKQNGHKYGRHLFIQKRVTEFRVL